MVDREKRAEVGNTEYLENEKRFFGEVKNIFDNYLRAIIW